MVATDTYVIMSKVHHVYNDLMFESLQDSTDLFLNCIKAVDPEELDKGCAKYVFKISKLAHAVDGVSATVFRNCKAEIKVCYKLVGGILLKIEMAIELEIEEIKIGVRV